MDSQVIVFVGDALSKYGFPEGHPFSIDRQGAFWSEAQRQGLDKQVRVRAPRSATGEELRRFHDDAHVRWVEACSKAGSGYVDGGDTPAFPGVFEAGASVVGTALEGLHCIITGAAKRTFQPVGGMHHSRRHCAAGFCVFNDIGVVIDTLRNTYGVGRIAYVDIDAHHGDGVFYPYESDPDLITVDIHEDGKYLYPGTGHAHETGEGGAKGTKLNIPMNPGAGDQDFAAAWKQAENHLRGHEPEFIIMQAGADGLAGDPLADLCYTPAGHARATKSLRKLAEETAGGRMMVFGGGGYDLNNIAAAWTAVLREMAKR
jgi:acetoin utilization protein AcuC